MEDDFDPPHPSITSLFYSSDFDSACSTPYVSAPSSPGRSSSSAAAGSFFYSAPASPMHFFPSSAAAKRPPNEPSAAANSFEFEFSGDDSVPTVGSMSSADELFLNGQIRPMKLSSHLQRPQTLAPLIDLEESEFDTVAEMREKEAPPRGRDAKNRHHRRRTRSMSPLRTSMTWHRIEDEDSDNDLKCEIKEEEGEEEDVAAAAAMSASSSRSSSGGRSSKRWIFLKEFLYRSKSEGRNNNNNNNNRINSNNSNRFWHNFSFSPAKDKKSVATSAAASAVSLSSSKESVKAKKVGPTNGVGKRRVPASAHEIHYKANRAQAEEMRKKTFLPYRQGLIGCLGFSSKSYGAFNGLAKALNPVSSR